MTRSVKEFSSVEGAVILRKLEKAPRKATFDCPLLGEDFPITDYVSSVKPLLDVLHASVSKNASPQSFLAEAKDRTRESASVETAATAVWALVHVLHEVLSKHGRIDQCL